jgi:parvulin-like peptidyl-prolyl isomerase
VGDYAGPVEWDGGAAVVTVFERREGRQMAIEEVQDEIEGKLLLRRTQEAQERWLCELRAAAYVKIYL